MAVISVRNLNITLGAHHILDDISFDIEKGDVIAVIGPNGSGKTTLLKALLGLIPCQGQVSILGHSPQTLSEISSKIGYVPQQLEFDRTMPVTVEELLSIHAIKTNKPIVQRTLASVGADKLPGKQLGVLSGGEFQRVLLALALLNQPEILFLDEPSAGIDIEGSGEVYGLIKDLQREKESTILLVSHDIDIVFRYANKVLCINHQLLCKGTPHEALTQEKLDQLYGGHHTLYEHEEKVR